MTAIGGTSKKKTIPVWPQVVIQFAVDANQFLRIGHDPKGNMLISWVGDPNAATKFNSKYEAKARTREIADIPDTRVFKMLEVQQ